MVGIGYNNGNETQQFLEALEKVGFGMRRLYLGYALERIKEKVNQHKKSNKLYKSKVKGKE